ncbi:MAG: CDP-alcohol phosphatidyltransferase family protein [Thermoanaerobaculia bacterium]
MNDAQRGVLLRGPWTLPNFITLLRLAALPFFLYAISQGRFGIALIVFIAAGISDGIDGSLARRFDMRSALGAYLDPIADKLLLMSSYLFLTIPSFPAVVKVPVWLAFLVISRDVLLLTVALLLILSSSKRRFPPTWLGKVTTVTLIITVLFVLCANLWNWPQAVVLIAFGAAATVTILSGFDYIYQVARHSAADGSARETPAATGRP